MNQKILNKVFIWGFLFLYLLVACISFCHAVQFFNIGNVQWMSITLAFAFELGLALSLSAILLSESNKSHTLPWILMVVLCFVQVVGNVYSTFKYISLSEFNYYQYLAKPLLFWIQEISEETVQIIISWIMGAILPIIALFMTDMVASNLKNMNDEEVKPLEKSETTSVLNENNKKLSVKKENVTSVTSHNDTHLNTNDNTKNIIEENYNNENDSNIIENTLNEEKNDKDLELIETPIEKEENCISAKTIVNPETTPAEVISNEKPIYKAEHEHYGSDVANSKTYDSPHNKTKFFQSLSDIVLKNKNKE